MNTTRSSTGRAEELAKRLVAYPSVSEKSNADISEFVGEALVRLGFEIETLTYIDEEKEKKVSLVAKRGIQPGGIAYSAHTDVVPAEDWGTGFNGPFEPIIRDGKLYGRGACDMKGSLACALAAAEKISQTDQRRSIYFLISADEEIGMQGARLIDRESRIFEEMVAHETVGIVGEPTELEVVHAHKGGEGIVVRAKGVSAHTSTGQGMNANDRLIPALSELLLLGQASEQHPAYRNAGFEPATLSWNMILVNEPQAVNVTPSLAEARIFMRTMPEVDHGPLLERIREIARKHGLEIERKQETPPWGVDAGSDWIRDMLQITGQKESKTVCYATDAAVLQRLKKLMICGPGSIEQAHRNDEWIALDQLNRGTDIYERAFRHWAC